jgi:hypothetical protein
MVEICAALKRLHVEMEEVVYVPDTRIVLLDVEEEEKMFHLLHHSEKLAIAFGAHQLTSWYSDLLLQESAGVTD